MGNSNAGSKSRAKGADVNGASIGSNTKRPPEDETFAIDMNLPINSDCLNELLSFMRAREIVLLSICSKYAGSLCWKLLSRIDADALFGANHSERRRDPSGQFPPYDQYLQSILQNSTNVKYLTGFEQDEFSSSNSEPLHRLLSACLKRNTDSLVRLGLPTSGILGKTLLETLPRMKTLCSLSLRYSNELGAILTKAKGKLPKLQHFRLVPLDFRHPVTLNMEFKDLMALLPLNQLRSLDISGIAPPSAEYNFPETAVHLEDVRLVWPDSLQAVIYPKCSSSSQLARVASTLIEMFGSADRAFRAHLMVEERSQYFSEIKEYSIFDVAVRFPGVLTEEQIQSFLELVENPSAIRFRVRKPDISFSDDALRFLLQFDQFDVIDNLDLLTTAASYGRTTAVKGMVDSLMTRSLKSHNLPESALSYIFEDAAGVRCTNILLGSLRRYLSDKKQLGTISWMLDPQTMEKLYIDPKARDSLGWTAFRYAPKALIGNSFYKSTCQELTSHFDSSSAHLVGTGVSVFTFLKLIHDELVASGYPDQCYPEHRGLLGYISVEEFCRGARLVLSTSGTTKPAPFEALIQFYENLRSDAPPSSSDASMNDEINRLCDAISAQLKRDNQIVRSWSKN